MKEYDHGYPANADDGPQPRRERFNATLPGGFSFGIEGQNIIKLLLIMVGFAFLGYLIWQVGEQMKSSNKQAAEEHKQLADGIAEMVYVISLQPEERKRLGLTMPRSLRNKSRDN